MRLDPLFRPRSIAIVGASEKPTIGRRLIASLDRIGFSGRVFPLNPNYASVLGRDCYPSFADLPEAPDVAAFCVGHRLVLDAFPAAAAIGCFIEAVRSPERFAAALDRAAMRDKPVVVLKVGRTERARHAIATHTAGEAGDPAAFSKLLRAHRTIEVEDRAEFTEMLAACQGLRRPAGRRFGVI